MSDRLSIVDSQENSGGKLFCYRFAAGELLIGCDYEILFL